MISFPEKKRYDCLLITNQDQPLEDIIDFFSDKKNGILLTTHQLFPTETACFSKNKVLFYTFADFLSDKEMEQIDNMALEKFSVDDKRKDSFISEFMLQSVKIKNHAVLKKITSYFEFQEIFCYNGLGVDAETWQEFANATLLSAHRKIFCGYSVCNFFCRAANFLKRNIRNLVYRMNIFGAKRSLGYILVKGIFFCFPNGTKRLNFCKGIEIRKILLSSSWYEKILKAKDSVDIEHVCVFLSSVLSESVSSVIVCSTIHNYYKWADLVFQDGYLPSNYTRSFYEYYRCKHFICNNVFTIPWLQEMHYSAVMLPNLIEIPFFLTSSDKKKFKSGRPHVLLALNHSGNWSALINRSDTDRIVIAFCLAARENPAIDFTVRCHPTMILPVHEGIYSRRRIEQFVHNLKLDNLFFSNNSLDEDLQNSDLIVGEYTNVLLCGFEKGIPGLIANLTGRRSFMDDFEKIGFYSVNSTGEFNEFFTHFESSFFALVSNNNRAIGKFNDMQRKTAENFKSVQL